MVIKSDMCNIISQRSAGCWRTGPVVVADKLVSWLDAEGALRLAGLFWSWLSVYLLLFFKLRLWTARNVIFKLWKHLPRHSFIRVQCRAKNLFSFVVIHLLFAGGTECEKTQNGSHPHMQTRTLTAGLRGGQSEGTRHLNTLLNQWTQTQHV